MPATLDDNTVLKLRARAQGLAHPRAAVVSGVLPRVGAIQAQDLAASQLALRARGDGLTLDAVTRACNADRAVVRTWLMRGTLHMVAAEDVRWLLRLLAPAFIAAGRRRAELGLDDALCERALPALREILSGGVALARAELVAALAQSGIPLDATTQAPAHLASYAALTGLICRGADRADGEPTYVLLDEWISPSRDRRPEDPPAALARLYLTGHGPATAEDLAWWAGISLRSAREGIDHIATDLAEVRIGDSPAWMLAGAPPLDPDAPPTARLLPAFDAYLLGYRRRDLALDPAFAKCVNAGGGWVHPTLCLDGRIVGTWKLARQKARAAITVSPFTPIDLALRPALDAEAGEIAHFLGVPTSLSVA
jgi:hypothetical protein